jgi:hypothetical protein
LCSNAPLVGNLLTSSWCYLVNTCKIYLQLLSWNQMIVGIDIFSIVIYNIIGI